MSTAAPAPKPRKSRSKSQDRGPALTEKKAEEKKTRSRSHDDSKKKVAMRTGAKRQPSAGGMSLEAGLSKVAGPSLQRQDFGRSADDDDTFCGTDAQTNKVHPKTRDPFAIGRQAPALGGRSNPFGGSAFGSRDDDSEEEEDIDFSPVLLPILLRT